MLKRMCFRDDTAEQLHSKALTGRQFGRLLYGTMGKRAKQNLFNFLSQTGLHGVAYTVGQYLGVPCGGAEWLKEQLQHFYFKVQTHIV